MNTTFNPLRKTNQTLSWLLSLLMATAPSIAVCAEPARQPVPDTTLLAYAEVAAQPPLKLQYLAPGAAAVIAARPQQLLTSEAAMMFPVEVVSAAALQELGFDPLDITQIVISVSPPLIGPPLYSAAITVDRPIDLTTLSPKLIAHTRPEQRNGKTYLRSQHPLLPSFGWADDQTLLIAPEITLQQLLSQKTPTKNPLVDKITALGGQDDLLTVVDLEALRGLIQMGLAQVANDAPPEIQPFLPLPTLLKSIHLRANLSGRGPWELVTEANDSADADKVSALIDQALELYDEKMGEVANQLLVSEDPIQQAMGQYQLRIMPQWAEQIKPDRDGNRFTLFHTDPDSMTAGIPSIAIVGVLVALLLPAVQAAREAARRSTSTNNMKNIMLALLNYESANGSFPPHASYDSNGKPLLSWRVHILPYLEQQALYEQFHLDEPWDSTHNQQLISQMPVLFVDPSSKHSEQDGNTHYLGAKGAGFSFDGTETGKSIRNFTDGTSNTIMVLQVNDQRATTWTKPDDWEIDPKTPMAGLTGSMHPGAFIAGFADGSVNNIAEQIDPEMFKRLLTIAGGEEADLDR